MSNRPASPAPTCGTCANFGPAWNWVDFNDDEGWCRLEQAATGCGDVWPCHVRPEPVAPPGLKPYPERDKGSAFGPPLECERCEGTGEVPHDGWWHCRTCYACHGLGYVNAVRMEG